jgi:diguanylate cyclase (GGDEF)-like protein
MRRPVDESGMMTSRTPEKKSELGAYFVKQHRGQWIALGLVLLLLVFAIDYATGFTLRLTELYLIPLLIFTWAIGRAFGILMSIVACTSWAYVEALNGRYITDRSLLYWDWGIVLFGFVIMVVALTELRKALDDAHFQSRKDTLTGLVNKGGFYQVVSAEIEVCRRYRRTLSIAYIDCDNFKTVNDRFGHHVGDDLLRVISKTMLRKLRSSDLPGRLGGDEFAVMLPETNAEACRMVVEMLQQRLLHEMKDHHWPVTFSIGIATFLRMPASIEDMIGQADMLMYAVKNTSKGAIKQEVFHG